MPYPAAFMPFPAHGEGISKGGTLCPLVPAIYCLCDAYHSHYFSRRTMNMVLQIGCRGLSPAGVVGQRPTVLTGVLGGETPEVLREGSRVFVTF